MKLSDTTALGEVALELKRARLKFKPFNSCHEGYAVLLEEVEELWAEIRKRKSDRSLVEMQREAVQVAAMAVRFVVDVTGGNELPVDLVDPSEIHASPVTDPAVSAQTAGS